MSTINQQVDGSGNIFSGTGNVTVNGISPQVFAGYVSKLAVTESALASFFKILEEQQVAPGDLDSKLREIATQYKELLRNWEAAQSTDPQAAKLKAEAKQAIEAGDYAKAEELLEDIARHHSLAAAEAYAQLADLQRVQLRYAKAAAYWQKAAALLPDDKKKERTYYLHEAGYDLKRVANKEALSLYAKSLLIRQEIGDKANEGRTLGNISQIYHTRGDCDTALKYLEQSLSISREIGDKEGEGKTLGNIGKIHDIKRDYDKALHLEQSLRIAQEIGDKANEGATLNSICGIHWAQGDYPTALKCLEQSLRIRQEIGDRHGEAVTSWNIGRIYEDQDDLAKAEPYMSRAVQLDEEIGLPDLESDRKALERVRAKLRGR